MSEEPNYQKIREVEKLCKKRSVGFDLSFCESDGTFYYSINSAAPVENFLGRNTSFDSATKNVIEHLNKLGAGHE